MDAAFDGVSDDAFENALGGVHALVFDEGELVGHSSVVQRRLLHAGRALRTGYVAAFSVPANQLPAEVFDNAHAGLKYDPEDTSEQLVIVGERAAGAHKLDYQPIADDIRAAIAVRHGVTVRDVLLVTAGSVPRTSSGKIGRRACRTAYLDGTLRSGTAAPNSFPDETD